MMKNTVAPIIAIAASTPTTIPAMAPPEIPESLELAVIGVLVLEADCAAAFPDVVCVVVLVEVPDVVTEEEEVGAAANCLVEKGVGSAV